APSIRLLAMRVVREPAVERLEVFVTGRDPVAAVGRGHEGLGVLVEILLARGPDEGDDQSADPHEGAEPHQGLPDRPRAPGPLRIPGPLSPPPPRPGAGGKRTGPAGADGRRVSRPFFWRRPPAPVWPAPPDDWAPAEPADGQTMGIDSPRWALSRSSVRIT